MPHSFGDSQLRKVIELDGVSGRFELDANGYTRYIPSQGQEYNEKRAIERWLGEEIERAEREHRARFDAQAENRETYSAIKVMLANEGGRSTLPSPIARIPADQIIASTHNNIMRPSPLFAADPYYEDTYKVLVPTPTPDPDDPAYAGIPSGTPMQFEVGAEEGSRRMEAGMDFLARERLDFENKNHRVVDGCVIEGYAWIKTCRKAKKRNIIKPKTDSLLVDVDDVEEIEYQTGSQIDWVFVHDSNMLRPNLTQEINDLPWLAERDPKEPDQIRAAYETDEYFLLDDDADKDEQIERLANTVSATVDEGKKRTDTSTRNDTREDPDRSIDVREVWAYRWLKVKDETTGKSYPRRFMLQLFFHYGARKLMAAFRNPYHHQERIHTVFSQYLDGSSTTGIVKYNQIVGTHLIQAEIKNAYTANNNQSWYDPAAAETAKFFAGGPVLSPDVAVPGQAGRDWGYVRGGTEHYSLMPLIEWNAGTAQYTSKVGDYETRGSAPSHTSPNVVSMLLDRGGQTSLLFLSMMNRGWRRCVRLYLETARQYQPLGEVLPIRDERTKTTTNIPFRYPIGTALDNFRFSLTAANEAAARERNPDNMASLMGVYQQHATFMMQPIAALISPDTTEEQAKMYRQMIAAGQKLLDLLIATQRVDEDTFNIVPAIDAVIAEKVRLLQQMEAQRAEMEAMNAATGQITEGGGSVPAAEGAGGGGASAGAGAESGMAGGPSMPPTEGVPPPLPPEGQAPIG